MSTTLYDNTYDIDGNSSDNLSGYSVSINNNGSIVAIGSRSNNNAGSVRIYNSIFKNDGSDTKEWYQLGDVIIGENDGDLSGFSVSMNSAGNIVAIGSIYNGIGRNRSSGHVRVYEYKDITASDGTTTKAWEILGNEIIGESAFDNSGWSVSMNSVGNIIAIGAINNDNNDIVYGHVRIYKLIYNIFNNTNTWSLLGNDIDGESANDKTGYSVSINGFGNIVAIGSPYNDINGNNSGYTRVYEYKDVIASDGTTTKAWIKLGNSIYGTTNNGNSGHSVSMNNAGNIVAIGAPYNNLNGVEAGHVSVYEYKDDGTGTKIWIKLGNDIYGESIYNNNGYSVSINSEGNIIAISSIGSNGDVGRVRVFKLIVTSTTKIWNQLGDDINGEAIRDKSGWSVSMNSAGNIVAIGATGNNSNIGHVRVFYYDNSRWVQGFVPESFFKLTNGFLTITDNGFIQV